ncbi:MAG TPA: thioredoxin [Planctomycetaceae bacterium]|nr:thioredoxin [Planctomycetaceae bacterium]
MGANVREFTDSNFQSEVLDSGEPVLVDFWAPWCVPCTRIAPMIEELAAEYQGKVRIGKLNIDENPQTPNAHQISAIPTVVVFKDGQIVNKFVGVNPKAKIAEALDSLVGADVGQAS